MRLRAFSVLVVAAGMVCLTCAPPSDSTPLAAELSLSVSADTYQTFPFNGRSVEVSSITVHAEPSGGVEPYSYRWSVTNPRGQSDDGRLSAIDVRAPVFTSGDLVGPYTLTCVVTDAAGRTVSDSIVITVGQQLVLDLRLGRQWVASGGGLNGQSTITAKPIGGTAPYTYEWAAIGPDGERDDDRLADTTLATQVFTSGDAVGTYIVSCSATDAEGLLFADSVTIVVSNLFSVDVGVDRQQLVPGGAANGVAFLTAYVEGGAPPYTYAWTVTGPDGLTDNERLDDATVAQPCFTSADINGTYRAACTVTDSSGQQLTDSVLILVGPGVVLTVTATRKEVAAAGGGTGQAGLTATALGGTGPLTYRWSVTNPDGQPENDRLDSLTIQSPTFTSSTTLGTYRIFCVVTDADGRMGFDSVEVFVGQPISVDVITNRQDVPADGGEATLTANALGGLPPYQYSWRVYNPSGTLENARLNSATVPSPVFTSVLTTGTYTVTCTVLDSGGFAAVDSVGLVVGGGLDQGLALDVATNRLNVPATGGAATLAAVVSGGVAPHTYQWTVTDPSGDNVTGTVLDSATIAGPTFTAPAEVGTYRAQCTVTDSVAKTFTDSVLLYVGQNLSANVTASRYSVVPSGGANGQATLSAVPLGGSGGYTYLWAVTNPAGGAEDARLSATNVQSPTFTSGATTGAYRVSCTVTDSFGSVFIDSISLFVGLDLSVAITTSRSYVMPGGGANGQAQLNAAALGGLAPYSYVWTVTNPSGAGADAQLSATDVQLPTFTSNATVGTYRIQCTVTDSLGARFTGAVHVVVGNGLSATLTTGRVQVLPGGGANGQATLTAAPMGGESPYTYLWVVTNPSGAGEDARLSATDVQSPTFTSAATIGTYRIACTVTDAVGASFADAVHVAVGNGLSVSLTTTRMQVMPGGGAHGQATLNAAATGGSGGYTYAWSVTNPSSAPEDARLNATNVQSPVFTSNATIGTYRIQCTVTDSVGASFISALHVTVKNGLSVALMTSRAQVIPGGGANGQATLSAVAMGGSGGYTYAWVVTTPAGGTDNTRLSATDAQAPTFTSNATVGTYAMLCTVTDSVGASAINSVHITVSNNLSVSVTTNKFHLVPGGGANGQATVSAAPLGGSGGYSYSWTVTTPAGGADNGRLSATNVQSPTFTSNATVGTYRLTCTVTDSVGASVAAALELVVSNGLSASLTTSRTQVMPGGGANGQATLTASPIGGSGGYTYLWAVTNPAGGGEDARLSSTAAQAPTFTSDATVGTYRLTCTVADSVGASFTAALHITVGNGLSASLTTTRTLVMPGGGANGQATLTASPIGGSGGYTYLWSATSPSGAGANARLSATNVQSPTFTSDATVGTYRLQCTVTDSVGVSFTDALHLTVSNGLSVSLTTTRTQVMPGGGANGQATLTASAIGGSGGYTYLWSATSPSGAGANARLNATNVQSPTFTSDATVGTYRLQCTVTDSVGVSFTDALHLTVSNGLSVSLVTTRTQVMPGGGANGQATLTASAIGGSGGYTYGWVVTTPAGGTDNTRLSATDAQAPTFTSDATVGTYTMTCTVTDSVGASVASSIYVMVGNGLSASLTTTRTQVLPGGGANGQATLTASPIGGSGGYTYLWSATSPSGAGANARLSATNVQSPTFTSDATVGTYRLQCTVTDSVGASVTAALHLTVSNGLSVSLVTTRTQVMPGGGANGQATLTASAIGGSGGYTYGWVVTTPAGGTDNTRLSATDVQAPTFTSDATVGTYTMTCTVTDSVGASVASSIYVMVGNGLSANVTTSRLQVLPGGGANGQATLMASAIGGSGGYTYLWAVTNPAGAGEDARLSATNVQSPTFTSTTTLGTYRITCTVTDSVGASFSAAVHVQVGAAVMFLDVRADTAVVLPGVVVTLIGDRTGGTANFNYSWRAYDSVGADQGTWGEDDDGGSAGGQQNNEADDVTQTWTAPSTATGTYRIVCTLTDSLGYTYVDSLEVYVPTSTLTLTAPANEDANNNPTSVLGVTTLGSLSTVVQVNTTLTYPRNLKVRCGDPGNSLAGDVWIEISGVSAQGFPQIEHFYFLIPGGGGYVTTEGVKPFARVDTARYVVVTGSASGNETIQIGVGDTFGLPRVIPAASSVRRVLLLPATTLETPADYSVITTPGQQGVRFTNPARDPNGANSYEILYDDN